MAIMMIGYLPLVEAKTQEMVEMGRQMMAEKIMRRICWARLFLFLLEVVGREAETSLRDGAAPGSEV